MSQQQFLVELGTEELPPKALLGLRDALVEAVAKALQAQKLAVATIDAFASPRRLALRVNGLPAHTPQQEVTLWGPPAAVAFDKSGAPTKAAEAFAHKHGIALTDLATGADGKVEKLVFKTAVGGEPTVSLLPKLVADALAALPINKRMRWGASRAEFVRPAHWLVMLLDDTVVPGEVLGLSAGRATRGHRFHANISLPLAHARDYESTLAKAYVLADFAARRERIVAQVKAAGEAVGGAAVLDDDLLDEVTALVEWPVALAGKFDQQFLSVPAEALISSMKEHQKYFHVVDANGQLMAHFITVANIESADVAQVIAGNEKVIRPRLADAAFFFDVDKKTPLTAHREKLKSMVFQAELGTLFDKTERVARLARFIATQMHTDPAAAEQAGRLAKADLVTSMVYEFADMQGIAGFYYAQNDGESDAVAHALREQYLPKFAKDALPATATGTALALADRLDTLAGIFGIGQVPTGSKDPFGLRRASVAVLRLLIENRLALDLGELLAQATAGYPPLPKGDAGRAQALNYMLERLRAWYEEAGVDVAVYQAVSAKNLTQPLDIDARMHAVAAFAKLPEAESLAAANKRVSNILAKQADEPRQNVAVALLQEPAEAALHEQLQTLSAEVKPMFARGDYSRALASLAKLRAPVDAFFDQVMVMVDDAPLRANRLALLRELRQLFLQVADISCLAAAK